MAKSGARPEELKQLRTHLSGLSHAVGVGDKVKAHESLMGLQHGFYAAHAGYEKEHGPGGSFPQHKFSPSGGVSPHESALRRRLEEQDRQRTTPWAGAPGHAKPIEGQTDSMASPAARREDEEKRKAGGNFYLGSHREVLEQHGYVRRGMGEYVHPKTGHKALIQIGGVTHYAPSGRQLAHHEDYQELHRHLKEVHKTNFDAWANAYEQAQLLEMTFDEFIQFRAKEAPAKPAPEDKGSST